MYDNLYKLISSLVIFFSFFGITSVFSQKGSVSTFIPDDSVKTEFRRIKSLRDFWYVKLISNQKNLSIGLEDKDFPGNKMEFRPNIGTYTGIGIFAFDVGLEVTWRIPPSPEENALFGPSKATDWQIHLYTRKMGADFLYQDYTGFYMDNPQNFYPDWKQGDRYPRQSDMKIKLISGAYYYVFRPEKFSFPSAFNQTEVQLKTGGSWLISGRFAHTELSDPVSIIPITDTNNITGLTELKSVRVTSINVLPGYSLNLIFWKKCYLNLSLAVGGGYQIRSYESDVHYQDNALAFANTWRIGFGYNSKRFFIGASGYTQTNNTKIQNLQVSSSNGFLKVFIGYRFMEKGFMKKSVFDLLSIFSKKPIE